MDYSDWAMEYEESSRRLADRAAECRAKMKETRSYGEKHEYRERARRLDYYSREHAKIAFTLRERHAEIERRMECHSARQSSRK